MGWKRWAGSRCSQAAMAARAPPRTPGPWTPTGPRSGWARRFSDPVVLAETQTKNEADTGNVIFPQPRRGRDRPALRGGDIGRQGNIPRVRDGRPRRLRGRDDPVFHRRDDDRHAPRPAPGGAAGCGRRDPDGWTMARNRLLWAGGSAHDATALRTHARLTPIRIPTGAFGPGRPSRDTLVSPQHRLVLRDWRAQLCFGSGEVLAPAKALFRAGHGHPGGALCPPALRAARDRHGERNADGELPSRPDVQIGPHRARARGGLRSLPDIAHGAGLMGAHCPPRPSPVGGGAARAPCRHLFPPVARSPKNAPMLKTRIIPCLDVADGRVVKGVNFVDLRDAGDPVEQAQAYDAAGADELCFSRHPRDPREPGHDVRPCDPHGGAVFHAAHDRRRGADGGGRAQPAVGRRRQGQFQLRRRGRPPT